MNEKENGKGVKIIRALEVAAVVFSVVTGFCSSALIIFKGGALVHEVDNHEHRLDSIEIHGSPPIAEHMKLDDEREARTRADLARMEIIVTRYADMGAQIQALALKLDMLRDQIQKKP